MLVAPDLPRAAIAGCLHDQWRLEACEVQFLPLGADANSAVYRVEAEDTSTYFLKLRAGPFDDVAVALPRFLADAGIDEIIAPLPTASGQLHAALAGYTAILYPFVAGDDGYEVALTDSQWQQFGRALRRIHETALPAALLARIRRETYSSHWRDDVLGFLRRIEREPYSEPVAAQTAAFLHEQRTVIDDLVKQTEELARQLRADPPPLVLCHSDLHAGNLLITGDGRLYIVDWDEPLLAPRERDLMAAGSGLMGGWRTAAEEETLFFASYGAAAVDPAALMYYRCERIVADIAAFCRQLLLTDAGGEDRPQALRWLRSNFKPGGTIDLAYRVSG